MIEETHTTLLPHAPEPVHFHWRSTTFAAGFYQRTRRRIVQWCVEGRFTSIGIPVYQDASRRWWIYMDASDDQSPSMKEG